MIIKKQTPKTAPQCGSIHLWPQPWEEKAGGSGVPDHPQLHSELLAILGYMRSLKQTKNKTE